MVTQTPAPKPATSAKIKREPQLPSQKITEALKKAAVSGRLNRQELESIAVLAGALQTFVSA